MQFRIMPHIDHTVGIAEPLDLILGASNEVNSSVEIGRLSLVIVGLDSVVCGNNALVSRTPDILSLLRIPFRILLLIREIIETLNIS